MKIEYERNSYCYSGLNIENVEPGLLSTDFAKSYEGFSSTNQPVFDPNIFLVHTKAYTINGLSSIHNVDDDGVLLF